MIAPATVAVIVLLVLAHTGFAATMSFQSGGSPTAGYASGEGVTIRTDQAATSQASNTQLIVGEIDADKTLRGLLSFDLSAIKAAAGGSPVTINSISLVLHTSSQAGLDNDIPTSEFVITSYLPFDETTATWNDPQGTAGDDVAGGTPGTALGSVTFDPVADTDTDQIFASSSAFVTAAEDALAADDTLYLMIYNPGAESYHTGGFNSPMDYFARFDSDNATNIANRPELIVDYSVVPEPATSVIAMLGAGLLAWKRRR